MKYLIVCTLLLQFLFSLPAPGECFRHPGPNGFRADTDALGHMPAVQWHQAGEYSRVSGPVSVDRQWLAEAQQAPQPPAAAVEDPAESAFLKEKEALAKQEDLLTREYRQLIGEKKELELLYETIKTDKEIIEYNRRIARYNEKMAAYREKRKSFESRYAGMRKDLEQRDDLLAEEYRTLMAEKEALVELNAAIETSEDAMAYNARLGGYNEKIIAFQEKRQRFENDVAAYNALVESRPNDQPAEEK